MLKILDRYVLENKEDSHDVRKGLITGSQGSRIIPGAQREMTSEEKKEHKLANPKSTAKYITDPYGIGESAETYIRELISVMKGAPRKDIQTFAMLRGVETEPFAVMAYCQKYGYDIAADNVIYTSQGGTVFYVGDNLIGATPDLIIQGERVVQFKCPESTTHLNYIYDLTEENFKQLAPIYYWQMQIEMMLAEVPMADFVSYDDRYTNEEDQMFAITIRANKEDQNFFYKKAQICEARKHELLKRKNDAKRITSNQAI